MDKKEDMFLEEAFETFERVEEVSEVIILGKDGGVRRVILE